KIDIHIRAAKVQRRDIDLSGVSRRERIIVERRVEVLSADVEVGLALGECEAAVAQVEAADGQVDDGFKPALGGLLLDLGLRDVRAAVGEHDYVGLRPFGQQISDIDESLERRGRFEIDLEQLGAKERVRAGALEAVDHEVVDLGAKVLPVEGK